ncbi:Cna B-type domain-containing protein [Alloscardovia theropitheci]|uniref:Cna B-type domain-containing protein n=1 Tax=Alloscardovia theropitheci TaxID=2496842 RepID=A0A4R0QXX7_9BIFI|nr:Cna B-type domain-containing protein [Alloscardovia theropitheci]TCD54550.1 Cna B-type domain-containing protein [Alloscardovia theropitheci]
MKTREQRLNLRRFIIAIISTFAIVASGLLFAPEHAIASEIPNVVTGVSIVDEQGNVAASGNNNTIRNLKIDFRLPDLQVHEGDTSTITIPQEFTIPSNRTFDVTTPDGSAIVAHGVINATDRTMTLTYTNYPETHTDISGSVQMSIAVNTNVVTEAKTFPVTIHVGQTGSGTNIPAGNFEYTGIVGDHPNEIFAKWGDEDSQGNAVIHYNLRVNAVGETLAGVTIPDELRSAGMSYDQSSFSFEHVKWTYVRNSSAYGGGWQSTPLPAAATPPTVTFSEGGKSFLINVGDLNGDGYMIRYDVKLSYTPVNSEVFNNYAQLLDSDRSVIQEADHYHTWRGINAEANGYNYTLKIKKVNEQGESLANAQFDIIRDRSGAVVGSVTTDSNGEASIDGLLRDDYTIRETSAPTGYALAPEEKVAAASFANTAQTASVTITDKYNVTSVHVAKTWDDQNNVDGKRPESVEVTLLADGNPIGSSVTLNQANNWAHEFTQLPIYNTDGSRITYTVRETAVTDYTATISGNATQGFTITNTHVPEETSLTVTKRWVDDNNQDGKRPQSVSIQLYADGSAEGSAVTLNGTNSWKHTFNNLPVYKNGAKIAYTVQEVNVPDGYTASVDYPDSNNATVTNTHSSETTHVKVTKNWDDHNNQDGARPNSVTVQLYADNVAQGTSQTLDAAHGWSYDFTNLPAYTNGQKISYTVQEVNTPTGYTVQVNDADMSNIVITNTHTPAVTNISITKQWDDNDDQDGARPDSISVQLLANGSNVGSPVTVKKSDNWTYTFENLPVNDNGQKISYTVQEVGNPSGYSSTVDSSDEANQIIVNSHTPEVTSLSVSKQWDDKDNQDGSRPQSVRIQLYADGATQGNAITLDASTNWKHTFEQLPVYKNGQKISYTVQEIDTAQGYVAHINADDIHNIIITNSHTPSVPPTPSTSTPPAKHLAKTGASVEGLAYSICAMLALSVVTFVISRKRKMHM